MGIAWAGAVLGLLATWIFLSVLAAVTGDTERQPALLAMPVFGAASAGILQLALRNVPGARMEPGLPFLAGELVLLTYYCPALWRIAGLAWRCARRMEVRHIKAGMWVVSWAAAADFALVMLRLSAIAERASGIQIARPEITAMNAVQPVLVIHLIGGATTSAGSLPRRFSSADACFGAPTGGCGLCGLFCGGPHRKSSSLLSLVPASRSITACTGASLRSAMHS